MCVQCIARAREKERKHVHCYTGYALHARCDPFTHTHVQDGCTALWLAYYNEHEATAAELIEATKRAGALDLQVPHEAGQGGCVV